MIGCPRRRRTGLGDIIARVDVEMIVGHLLNEAGRSSAMYVSIRTSWAEGRRRGSVSRDHPHTVAVAVWWHSSSTYLK